MSFATPLLLLGLLAAGIPFLLHLLSSVKAREELFPTLRFLKLSMEKTARRRRIQHWLLLLLRAALLALLAIAVAQPITEATGGWTGTNRASAVVVLDNSFSMAATSGGGTRLSRAKSITGALLGGDEQPALATIIPTASAAKGPAELSTDMAKVRQTLGETGLSYGPPNLARAVARGIETLQANRTTPHKTLYLVTDLQQADMDALAELPALKNAGDVHLMVLDTADDQPDNVGLTALDVSGRLVRDAVVTFTASVTNAAPTDRTVEVLLKLDGASDQPTRQTIHLRSAGRDGATRKVRFHQRFTQPGDITGRVLLRVNDELPEDNVRRFALHIGGRVRALLVRGPSHQGIDPAYGLGPALNPWGGADKPWPIDLRTVEAEAFTPADLEGVDAVYLAQVPALSADQARGLARWTAAGGAVMIFLGADTDAANYNEMLIENAAVPEIAKHRGLLPGRLTEPVGQAGARSAARRLAWVDTRNPLLAGLHNSMSEYLSSIVYRYWRLDRRNLPGTPLIRLSDGQPVVMTRLFGDGSVVLVTTTSSPEWTNFPGSGIFLPMVKRAAMQARRRRDRSRTFAVGQPVTITPGGLDSAPEGASPVVRVDLPSPNGDSGKYVTLGLAGGSATFTRTDRPGLYTWQVEGAGPAGESARGVFAVNAHGPESNLATMDIEQLRSRLRKRGLEHVYAGTSLAEVHAAAAADAEGTNWWDLGIMVVIFLLVIEAILANRRRREEMIPAHLNPSVAGSPRKA
ncbi:MAG: BatA domain-containing protein [Phycisphaerae bacterium]